MNSTSCIMTAFQNECYPQRILTLIQTTTMCGSNTTNSCLLQNTMILSYTCVFLKKASFLLPRDTAYKLFKLFLNIPLRFLTFGTAKTPKKC